MRQESWSVLFTDICHWAQLGHNKYFVNAWTLWASKVCELGQITKSLTSVPHVHNEDNNSTYTELWELNLLMCVGKYQLRMKQAHRMCSTNVY